MNKVEEILKKHYKIKMDSKTDSLPLQLDEVYEAAVKEVAIDFFIWNAKKVNEYMKVIDMFAGKENMTDNESEKLNDAYDFEMAYLTQRFEKYLDQ